MVVTNFLCPVSFFFFDNHIMISSQYMTSNIYVWLPPNLLKRKGSKVVLLSQCLGQRPVQRNSEKSFDWSTEKNFQKYIHCRVIEDQSRKVELLEVNYAVRSYPILRYLAKLENIFNIFSITPHATWVQHILNGFFHAILVRIVVSWYSNHL